MAFNLSDILRQSAARLPDKIALILDDARLTYAELDDLSDRVAANLGADGLAPGQRVGVMLPNLPEFVIAYYGILKAGGVVVPINPLYRGPEVAHYLRDSDARALIAWEPSVPAAAAGAATVGDDVRISVVGLPGHEVPPEGTTSFRRLLREGGGRPAPATMADDTAVILYTSGTTGRPKGAELTHFNLFMNCHIVGLMFGVQERDVVLAALPLFHAFGQSSVMNIAVHFGCTLSLLPRFEAPKALDVIQRDRVTLFSGVPTMFFALLAEPALDQYDTSSLRTASSGGASMPAEVLDAFERRFRVPILEGYGLSETSPTATFNQTVEDRRVYSVGKPIWGVEVSVLGLDGTELPAGREHVGELAIRGHCVMKGYHGNPEATAEALEGGWLRTGDMGYRDEDGFLFIVDRKKDLVIRGGMNVYPREVEEVLFSHPSVAQAAVIGVPDPRLGEEVMAVVSLRQDAAVTGEELIAYCRERLAAYKYPRSVHFMDALPIGGTGKIEKKLIREALAGVTAGR
ncbi:MAG TPA: long-chain fatty acid--CoA ligase [Candidatus Dormibacteraeota bacterium]|nr:long-chain fatty acid--CoA ligase [Candidatus Dormibacteraeota bacterium]